jgi:hypothetical protein
MGEALRQHIFNLLEGHRFVRGCGCRRTYEQVKRIIRDRIIPMQYEQAVRYAAEYLGLWRA